MPIYVGVLDHPKTNVWRNKNKDELRVSLLSYVNTSEKKYN